MTTRTSSKRKNTLTFWMTALGLSVLVAGSVHAAANRWSIAIDSQENQCLPPYRIWVIDKKQTTPIQGEIFAFSAKNLDPLFPDGTTIVKVVEGMPGDEIRVTEQQTTINGRQVATGLQIAHDFNIDPKKYVREGHIPDDSYWFFGRTADSFDSRYWGSVKRSQVVGRAYPIW
jgi:conjugal transfer pilin signal peptidase TrbI